MLKNLRILTLMVMVVWLSSVFDIKAATPTITTLDYEFFPNVGNKYTTTTLSGAITYINRQTQGGKLILPPGNIGVTSSLIITRAGITLSGYGGDSLYAGTVLQTTTPNMTVIDIRAQNVTIQNIGINGELLANDGLSISGNGIKLSEGADGAVIKKCAIKGYEYGIYKNSSYYINGVLIEDCMINTCKSALISLKYINNLTMKDIDTLFSDGDGVALDHVNTVLLDRFNVTGVKGVGMYLTYGDSVLMDQCVFDATTLASLIIYNSTGQITMRDGWIATSGLIHNGSCANAQPLKNNNIRRESPGIQIHSPNADVTIESNLISFCGGEGVLVTDARSVNLIGNNFGYEGYSEMTLTSRRSAVMLENFNVANLEGNTFYGAGKIQHHGLSAVKGNTLTLSGNQFYISYNNNLAGCSNVNIQYPASSYPYVANAPSMATIQANNLLVIP